MKCLNCGKEFTSKRTDAKFCSDKCRKAYSRKADKIISDIKADKTSKVSAINKIISDKKEIKADKIISDKQKFSVPPEIRKLSKEELYARIDHYPADTWKDSLEFKELKRRLNSMSLKDLKEQGYWIPNRKIAGYEI